MSQTNNLPAPGGTLEPTPRALLKTVAALPDAAAYFVRDSHGWRATSRRDLLAQVQRAARALVAAGLHSGDVVCVLGFNRPEWLIMDHAAGMAGAACAGIYWTSAANEVVYILQHSQAPVLLLEDAQQWAKIADQLGQLPSLKLVVFMAGAEVPKVAGVLGWDEFLALGDHDVTALQAQVDARLKALTLDDLGALIYTSGTTGRPKSVKLSHGNLAWTAQTLNTLFETGAGDRLISYLPMAHVAEKVGGIHGPAHAGNAVYFASSIEQLLEHMKEVRPTVYFGVPRLWEKMRAGLAEKLASATGTKAILANWARRTASAWHAARLSGKPASPWLNLNMQLARALVLGKVKKALGLDQARILISGAAPISADNLEFFLSLDLPVLEVYGQSEGSGPTSINLAGHTRVGSVGKALPGIELRIADDGEVLVKGPGVFQGYAGDPHATAQTLQDGWLYTGDLGRLDEDAYLFITGRKKDLIITSGGKNISPGNIEADLMSMPLIENAIVVGDNRHFLTALLTLKADALQAFAEAEGLLTLPRRDLLANPQLLFAVQAQVDQVNSRQARVAHVRKFTVLDQAFTIEQGQLTPTGKLRRKAVIDANSEVIEAMYRG